MTIENNAVPTEEQLLEQTPATQETQETTPEQPTLDPESPFAPFQELREQMTSEGFDWKGLDEKVSNREEISEEELAPIAEKSGHKVADIKAYLGLYYKNVDAQAQLQTYGQKEAEKYLAELDELAGGNHQELLDFIGQQAAADPEFKSKVTIWQSALDKKDPDIQRAVIKEMQAYRLTKQPLKPTPPQSANLDLLTKANTTAAKAPQPAQAKDNPLDGNPLVGLDVGQLCRIMQDPSVSPDHKRQANAVLKVRHPHLAVENL